MICAVSFNCMVWFAQKWSLMKQSGINAQVQFGQVVTYPETAQF